MGGLKPALNREARFGESPSPRGEPGTGPSIWLQWSRKLAPGTAQALWNVKEIVVTIATRLTERFGIKYPIVVASTTPASGGALVSAVAAAGGLALLGGGYVDRVWFEAESAKVTRSDVGAAFMTWSIPDDPGLLDIALERHPRAMMLSFSNPVPYAARVKRAGVPLICQVHTLDHALQAVDAGAEMVVTQGTETGGHGWTSHPTKPFLPSVVDALAARAPDVLILAVGAIADGRSLAASLMLGADGMLIDTRFWPTREALIPNAAKVKVVAASADETMQANAYDIVRGGIWPPSHTGRIMRNDFFERIGAVRDIPTAGELIDRIVAEASERLMRFAPTPGVREAAYAEA
jgi:nitronate monooxygenase